MEKFIKFIFVLILMPAICFSQIKTIAIENMDNTVKPGDNFYLYVNGGWLSKAVIPPYLNRYGSFDELQESNITNLKSLVDELISNSYPDGSNYQKISDFLLEPPGHP